MTAPPSQPSLIFHDSPTCMFYTRRMALPSQCCGHPSAHLLMPIILPACSHTCLLIWFKSSAFFKIPYLHGISALQNLSPSIPVASGGGPTSWLLSHTRRTLLGTGTLAFSVWWTLFPTCQSSTESMFLDTGDAWWLWYWCVKDIDLFFYHVFFLLLIACHPQDSHEDSPPP